MKVKLARHEKCTPHFHEVFQSDGLYAHFLRGESCSPVLQALLLCQIQQIHGVLADFVIRSRLDFKQDCVP